MVFAVFKITLNMCIGKYFLKFWIKPKILHLWNVVRHFGKNCTLHDCDSLVHYYLTTSISYVKFNFTEKRPEISWECFWKLFKYTLHHCFQKAISNFCTFSKRFQFRKKKSQMTFVMKSNILIFNLICHTIINSMVKENFKTWFKHREYSLCLKNIQQSSLIWLLQMFVISSTHNQTHKLTIKIN